MPGSILFVDPSVTSANAILVDGVSYSLIGPTDVPPDTTEIDGECSDCDTDPCSDCPCLDGAIASAVSIAAGFICSDEGGGTSNKYTWESYDVMLTGGPCEWDGSPESAPTNSEFNCSDDSCEDCTLVGSDTDPADFGANLFLQTTPDCQWILEIFGFAEAFNVRTETKGYDGGEPRGIYSGGSVVT